MADLDPLTKSRVELINAEILSDAMASGHFVGVHAAEPMSTPNTEGLTVAAWIDRFTAIPELGLKVTYQIKPGIQLFAGYDVLYWPRVARAGDQVDIGQDPRQNPSSFNFTGDRAARPAVLMRDTDFWAHGLSFGVRVEY